MKRAIDEIDRVFDEQLHDIITYNELCDRLNMDPANFRKSVRKSDSFWQALRERGLEETEDATTRAKGLQPSVSPFPVDEDDEEDDTDPDGWVF